MFNPFADLNNEEMLHQVRGVGILLIIYSFYLLRDTKFGFLWRLTKIFFTVLLLTLATNFIKKEGKEWWNKK